jgi:uncharacterized protein YlxW (UPF0749 family)
MMQWSAVRALLSRRMGWGSAGARVLAACLLGLLGFLGGVELGHAPRYPLSARFEGEVTARVIAALEAEQRELRRSIEELQRRTDADLQVRAGLRAELGRERLAAGLVAVRGEGVVVRLDDSTLRALPPNEDPSNYLIHDYDIRDVVNALWAAGAEAIAINDQRVVAVTAITGVGPAIVVNETRLAPPFEVRAIGNAVLLEEAAVHSPLLRKLHERIQTYALQFRVVREREIVLPPYRGPLALRYVQLPLPTRLNDHGD